MEQTMTAPEIKTTKYFSRPLINQTIKSNLAITIAVLVISCLICFILSFAMSILSDDSAVITEATQMHFTYGLMALAENGQSFEAFQAAIAAGNVEEIYGDLFPYVMMNGGVEEVVVTLDEFIASIELMSTTKVGIDAYVTNFEYAYALMNAQGAFSGASLSLEDAMANMLNLMGLDEGMLETMSNMDATSMMNMMYYHMIGTLPMLIWLVVVGNSVIASQVDRGSMAYVLSTPTKRSAVVITQAVYLVVVPLIMTIITCAVKIGANAAFLGSADAASTVTLYLGMYLLIEALSGICYFGSCFFNRTSRAMAFGGTFTVWFFLACLIGMFGSEAMVSAGMGVESLDAFNYLTIMTLFDIDTAATVGSEIVETAFIWKYVILLVIAAATYIVGAIRFVKKDLPL